MLKMRLKLIIIYHINFETRNGCLLFVLDLVSVNLNQRNTTFYKSLPLLDDLLLVYEGDRVVVQEICLQILEQEFFFDFSLLGL